MTDADRLQRQRDRAISIILSVKEREIDHYLPPAISAKLRKVVLDQLNEFHQVCLDALDTGEGRTVANDLYTEKLAQLSDDVGEIRRLLADRVAS